MIHALAILGAILSWVLISKGISIAYWRGKTRRIEITDSYMELIRETIEQNEQKSVKEK